jgi:hypothetical protein
VSELIPPYTSTDSAQALRNGQNVWVDATGLLPGDVIRVSEGMHVPADTRILQVCCALTHRLIFTHSYTHSHTHIYSPHTHSHTHHIVTTYSFTHSLTHSLTGILTHSLAYSLTHWHTHSFTLS